MVEKQYLQTPYNQSLAYGKAKLSLIVNKSVTADYVKKYFEDWYMVSSTLWKKLFGSENSISQETVETLPFKEVKSISTLTALSTQRVDLLSTDVVMGIISKFEKAVQISTQAYNIFINDTRTDDSTKMRDIYIKNFNDGSDLSLYELTTKGESGSFNTSSILFTTRLGPLEFEFNEPIEYLVKNASKEREGRFLDAYATEFSIEMLQNSLLDAVENDQNNTQTPLSCGFMIIKNPGSGKIQNIRLYSSQVFESNNRRIAISSGVNLFDFLDIAQFYEGVSSSHFAILMMNICDNLNRANLEGFTETNTTWEFGLLSTFDRLKCVKSVYNPSWTNQLINECILAGTTVNISRRLYYIVEYLNTEFSTLQDNQMIIISFADGEQKVVSIIQIHRTDSGTTFQTKDARIDNLFPQNEINADTIIKGELQVANYKGDTIMHVDPTTSSVTIMGKLGINQELHEIKGMIDVDNLSNVNMKQFINSFTPFIRETIQSMHTLPTQQPISSDDVLDNITTYILPLQHYTSHQVMASLSRAERFGKIQGIAELPVRMFAVIDAYEILNEFNNRIMIITAQIKKLESAKAKRIEEEEEAKKWAAITDAVLTTVVILVAIASAGAAGPVAYGLAAVASIGSEAIDRTDPSDAVGNLDGLTSDEIQQKIDKFTSRKNTLYRQAQTQTITIDGLIDDIDTQANLLGMGGLYKAYVKSQVEFVNCSQFYAVAIKYATTQINKIIEGTSLPSISGRADTMTAEIDDLLEAIENPIAQSLITNINAVLDEMIMKNFIDMYLKKTKVVPDDMKNFINTMKSHPIYNENMESHIFLRNYIDILGANLHNARDSINTGKSDIVNATIVVKEKVYRTVDLALHLQKEIDDAQLYYDTELYRYELYKHIKATYSGMGVGTGNYHTLNEYCSRDGKKQNRKYHKHFNTVVDELRSAKPTQYSIDSAGPLWFVYDSIGRSPQWSRLNEFGGKVSSHLNNLIQNQLPVVNAAKDKLEELKVKYRTYSDELQDYTDTQNWDIETHNRLQQVISAWLKMFTIYGGEKTFAIVVPVTDKTSNVGSIYYLKAFIKIDDNNNPTLLLSGRSLNIDEYTRDLSYRETLYTLVSALTSSCQLINYCTLFLEKDIDTAITDKIQSDTIFIDRFDGTSLFVSVVDITNQKIIQNEEYAYWKGHSFDQVYLPDTNITMSDIYKNTNANFKEQYGFDPSSPDLSEKLLENVYIIPTKYDDTWRLVVMRFIVKTDFNTQVKTIYRVSCNINVNEYINQSIISRGDATMYGDFTVKTSTDKEIFQIDTLNKTVSNIYPLGIGSHNPTTMLDINDTSISNIHSFIDTISSKMKDLQIIHEYPDYDDIYSRLMDNYTKAIERYNSLEQLENEYISLREERDSLTHAVTQEMILKEQELNFEIIDNRSTAEQDIKDILGSRSSYIGSIGHSVDLPSVQIIIEHSERRLFMESVNRYLLAMFMFWDKYLFTEEFMNNLFPKFDELSNYYDIANDTDDTVHQNAKTLFINIIMELITVFVKAYKYLLVINKYKIANDTDRNPRYIYELPTDTTKNAEDIIIKSSSLNPKWVDHTFKEILEDNIDNDHTNIIKHHLIPSLQDILDKQLLYDGSVYTTFYRSVNGDIYTVNTVFEIDNKLLVLGSGIDIQQFNININNPNVSKLLNKITQNINSLNYTYYNSISSSNNVQNVFGYDETQEYLSLLTTQGDIFEFESVYTLNPSVKNLLDNKVNGTAIKDVKDHLKKELHTSFLVNYTKNDSNSSFGIVNARDNNNDYMALYYKYTDANDSTKLHTFYLDMTNKLFVSSVSLNGDMSITGKLELFRNNYKEEKFITIDPGNSYLGINTNDRFLNYELEYQTTSSIYNSKQHVVAFSDSYPNVAFERQSETKEDSNDPDYSRFGSYSSSTMVRVSKLWDYDEIMKRVDLLNGSNIMNEHIQNVTYKESEFKWQFHRTYGPDISFEIKDKSDVNVELGQLKMVIDKREDKTIHAGFGVQVVDTTLSTGFEGSLKNILYVNNDSQLFVEGVWLGGKLFHMKEGKLMWGDNIIFNPTPTPV
jgi:hypothetical protein